MFNRDGKKNIFQDVFVTPIHLYLYWYNCLLFTFWASNVIIIASDYQYDIKKNHKLHYFQISTILLPLFQVMVELAAW